MKVSPQLLHSQRHSIFAAIAAAALVLLGGMALVGWLLHLEALKRIIPGAPAMRPNMAAGFLLCRAKG